MDAISQSKVGYRHGSLRAKPSKSSTPEARPQEIAASRDALLATTA